VRDRNWRNKFREMEGEREREKREKEIQRKRENWKREREREKGREGKIRREFAKDNDRDERDMTGNEN